MKYFISIVLAFTFSAVFSQDFDKVYYNDTWEITSLKFATYYRQSGFDDQLIAYDSVVTDYYINGKLEMTGFYKNGIKDGDFIFYNPDGSIRFKANYCQNKRNGSWVQYYPNGILMKEVQYQDNKERLIKYNNSKGKNLIKRKKIKYKQIFYFDEINERYYSDKPNVFAKKYTIQGKLNNGFKHGLWTMYDNLYKVGILKYQNGSFVSGQIENVKIENDTIDDDPFQNLIFEPEKINITESFKREPGQLIKNNYVIKALLEEEKKNRKKMELANEIELMDFFDRNFSYYVRNCSDTTTIEIKININENGSLGNISFSSNASKNAQKEASRVFENVLKLETHLNDYFKFKYRIMCLEELDFKK